MHTTQEYILAIKQLIAESNPYDAIDLLAEMAEKFQIPKITNEIPILRSRLKDLMKLTVRGIASPEEAIRLQNGLVSNIMQVLTDYESGRLLDPIGASRQNGRIVHNIPPRMTLQEEMYCSVRIAKDDMTLLKDFELPEVNKPENVEMSKTMEVTLVDPSGGTAFAIRMISPKAVQEIVGHTFTEWDFGITPLKNGRQLMIMYAHFIDKLDGEETRRTISFKKAIEITTEPVEVAYKTWEPTDIVIDGSLDKAKSGIKPEGTTNMPIPEDFHIRQSQGTQNMPKPQNQHIPKSEETENRPKPHGADTSSKSIKTLVLLLTAGAVFAGLAYWVKSIFDDKTPKNQEKPTSTIQSTQSNLVQPILVLEKSFPIETIEISGKAALNWTYNQDSTEINLPEQAIGTYFFNVKGRRGSCTQTFKLTKDNNRVIMSCKLSETINIPTNTPKPQSRKFSLNILTTFRLPIIKIDGNIVAVDKTVSIGNIIRSVVTVQEGSHQILATDQNGMNICNQKTMDVNDNNLTVDMACKRETRNIIIQSIGLGATSDYENTYVKLGNVILDKNTRYRIDTKKFKSNNPKANIEYMEIEILNLVVGEIYEVSIGKHATSECKQVFTVKKDKNEVFIACNYENVIQ
jgi:Effector-associated domain 11